MNEVVFDTEAEADAQQAIDYDHHMAGCTCPDYTAQTLRWAVPVQRNDGKWAYPCHPTQDYTGFTVEVYDPNNYPQE